MSAGWIYVAGTGWVRVTGSDVTLGTGNNQAARGDHTHTPVGARAATTANITLSGLQTIDGVALAANDVVLVWRQTTLAQNGVYVAGTGGWTRHTQWDTARKVAQMKQIAVEEGTLYGGQVFNTVDWKATAVIGTTAMLWMVDILATAQSSSATVGYQSWTDLSLGETYDPFGIYAAPVYTIPVKGIYELEGGIFWSATRAGATSHLLYAAVLNNSTEITRWSSEASIPASGQGTGGSATLLLSAGDTIKFRAYQDGTNGNLQVTYPTSKVRLLRPVA